MNIELARTFLEVVAAGNFVTAARRLHVTQSTVSTRIKALEDQLGRQLFVRTKSGATLTPTGEQFQRYAITLTQVWEQARHQIAVPQGYASVLAIGGQPSLWDALLLKWLQWMRTNASDVSLRAEYGLPGWLMQRLTEGMIDIAVLYTPQTRPGLRVERLMDDELVLVRRSLPPTGPAADSYVFVDWGPEFRTRLSLSNPDFADSSMVLDLGSLALQHILQNGGSGYFPRRIVNPYLETEELLLVQAPIFTLSSYMVYPEDNESDALRAATTGLRSLAAEP